MKRVIWLLIAAVALVKLLPDEEQLVVMLKGERPSAPALLNSEAVPRQFQRTAQPPVEPSRSFSCDGRTYCSQMTSCAEATFFLRNCPGVKMDGNHDGVPCEIQWCR